MRKRKKKKKENQSCLLPLINTIKAGLFFEGCILKIVVTDPEVSSECLLKKLHDHEVIEWV